MRISLIAILGIGLPAIGCVYGQTASWTVVGSASEAAADQQWNVLAPRLLGKAPFKLVSPSDPKAREKTGNRMVIGTPSRNAIVSELAAQLGFQVKGGKLHDEKGKLLPAGMGVSWVTKDPDGDGTLVLLAGNDAAGLRLACATKLDTSRTTKSPRFLRDKKPASPSKRNDFRTAKPEVLRLDLDFEHLLKTADDSGPDSRALRVARGLLGYADIYARVTMGRRDLYPFVKDLLRHPAWKSAREFAVSRDLSQWIKQTHANCMSALGNPKPERPRPTYILLYGSPSGTNAATIGIDRFTKRVRVVINLCRIYTPKEFEIALIHETVHTVQDPPGKTLLDHAMMEGVATYLSQALRPNTAAHEALMWTPSQLKLAEKLRPQLIKAFAKDYASEDARVRSKWLQLPRRRTPATSDRAPSRSGYYLGYLAARTWHRANPRASLGDLLTVPAETLLQALEKMTQEK